MNQMRNKFGGGGGGRGGIFRETMNQMRNKFGGGDGGGGGGNFRETMNQMRNKFRGGGGGGGRRKFGMRKQMNRGSDGGELESNDLSAQSVWDRRARRLDVWAQAFGGGQGNDNGNNIKKKKKNGMLDLRPKFRAGVGGINQAFRSGLAQQCTCPNGETPVTVTVTAPEGGRGTDDYGYDGYEEEEEGEELTGGAAVDGGDGLWSGF